MFFRNKHIEGVFKAHHCHAAIMGQARWGPHGSFNLLRLRRNGRYNADDIFKCIFLKENVWIPNMISLTFVPKGPINNIPSLVQIMAWRWPGDKPLSEPMMVRLPTHICVTWPQWVKAPPHSHMYPMNFAHIWVANSGAKFMGYMWGSGGASKDPCGPHLAWPIMAGFFLDIVLPVWEIALWR